MVYLKGKVNIRAYGLLKGKVNIRAHGLLKGKVNIIPYGLLKSKKSAKCLKFAYVLTKGNQRISRHLFRNM